MSAIVDFFPFCSHDRLIGCKLSLLFYMIEQSIGHVQEVSSMVLLSFYEGCPHLHRTTLTVFNRLTAF